MAPCRVSNRKNAGAGVSRPLVLRLRAHLGYSPHHAVEPIRALGRDCSPGGSTGREQGLSRAVVRSGEPSARQRRRRRAAPLRPPHRWRMRRRSPLPLHAGSLPN